MNIRKDVIEKFLDTEIDSEEDIEKALKMLNEKEKEYIKKKIQDLISIF